MTFDAAFQQLGERMASGAWRETALAPFTHLLIDEFRMSRRRSSSGYRRCTVAWRPRAPRRA